LRRSRELTDLDIEGVPRVAKPDIDHAALDGSAVEAARADDAPVAGPGGGYRGRGRSARRMWVVLDLRVRDAGADYVWDGGADYVWDAGADYVWDAGGLHAGRYSRLVRASACRHRRHQAGHQFPEHCGPECADPGPSSQPECIGTVQATGRRASVRDQQPPERPEQPGQFAESCACGRADRERGHAGNNCHPEPCFRAVVHLPGRRGNGRADDRDERLAQLSSAARRLGGLAEYRREVLSRRTRCCTRFAVLGPGRKRLPRPRPARPPAVDECVAPCSAVTAGFRP